MTGLEIPGLVFGVLPLVVSALENYDNVLEPITRYRQITSKVRDIHESMQLERAIFRAECVLLLSTQVSGTEAQLMLTNLSHRFWRDDTINRALDNCFGSLGEPCGTVIGKIVNKLGEISLQLKDFDKVVGLEISKGIPPERSWQRMFKSKLKFSLRSSTVLDRRLNELRRLNEVFITLSSQARQLQRSWPSVAMSSRPPIVNRTRLNDLKRARRNCSDLYALISRSQCTAHSHSVHFNLSACVVEHDTQNQKDINLCKLLFCSEPKNIKQSEGSSTEGETITLGETDTEMLVNIESDITGKPPDMLSSLSSLTLSTTTTQQRGESSLSIPAIGIIRKQASEHGIDLCKSLHAMGTSAVSTQKRSVKMLIDNHQFSLGRIDNLGSTMSLSRGLEQKSPRGQKIELPLHQRLGIASQLSNDVLLLYDTPWLENNLNSAAIQFRDSSSSRHIGPKANASSLYVNVPLDNTNVSQGTIVRTLGIRQATTDMQTSRFGLRTGPPNIWLYHLGILLLELAYHTPFSELEEELRAEYTELAIPLPADPSHSEYTIACQLAENAGTILGPKYADVVRRCLHCTFEACQSTDLDDTVLQHMVLENVVCKLETLQKISQSELWGGTD